MTSISVMWGATSSLQIQKKLSQDQTLIGLVISEKGLSCLNLQWNMRQNDSVCLLVKCIKSSGLSVCLVYSNKRADPSGHLYNPGIYEMVILASDWLIVGNAALLLVNLSQFTMLWSDWLVKMLLKIVV